MPGRRRPSCVVGDKRPATNLKTAHLMAARQRFGSTGVLPYIPCMIPFPLRRSPACWVLLLPLIAGRAGAGVSAPAPDSTDAGAFAHGPSNRKEIALTFDACSTMKRAGYDSAITRILVETRTPATIFMSGRWAEQWPGPARALAMNSLFEIGNHSYRHPHLMAMKDAAVSQELLRAQRVLQSATGRAPVLFRPPYGEYDARIVALAKRVGLTTVEYSLPSGDPDPRVTKERLIHYVSTRAGSGAVVVMHINGRGWHTAEALPAIIAALHKKGFTFVTVSQLIAASKGTRASSRSPAPAHALSRSR